jgi:hypothetical protein
MERYRTPISPQSRHEGTIVDTPTTIHVTQVILCSGAAGLG